MTTKDEARVRKLARKAGLAPQKDPRSRHYAYDCYMIVDPYRNWVVAGSWPIAYSLSLEQAEAWLAEIED